MQKKQRGSIIAFTLIVLSFILTSGLAVITVASLERKSGLVTQKSVTAFQAADGGAERILKRIYIDNSPSTMTIPKNGSMPDATLDDVAQNLTGVQAGATCNAATDAIVATSNSTPAYTFQATLLDGSDAVIDCADATWRDKVVRMRVDGFYRQTTRVIELGIKPRPKCGTTDTVVDVDGNSYGIVQIGRQCWMAQNMRVGTMINGSTDQSDNDIIEKYCYNDQANNCTSNHPNEPDGGLYTWSEAMQYSTNEGAQGICPDGWHIPTNIEAYTMENYLDSTVNDPSASIFVNMQGTDIGLQLRPGGSSGFEMNYTGGRYSGGTFLSRAEPPGNSGFGGMWISERGNLNYAGFDYIQTSVNFSRISRQLVNPDIAYTVRCILN